MLKTVGLLLLSAAVAAVGFVIGERLSIRKKCLEQLTHFARNCTSSMKSRHDSVFSIFKEYGTRELRFLQRINAENISQRSEILAILKNAGISDGDLQCVADFILGLGSSDLEGQKAHCEYFADKFSAMLKSAEKEADEKGRLARSLSVLAGIALFIMAV